MDLKMEHCPDNILNHEVTAISEKLISIIICGTNEEYFVNISKNINDTIGTNYELLYFDNKTENKSISRIYNFLKQKAVGELVCFMHEDLLIKTDNWGEKLIEIFSKDTQIGLVGVAGAMYKSSIPSSWSCINPEYLACNYIQHFKDKTKQPITVKYNTQKTDNEVVTVDGLFMCINKFVNQNMQFDEESIKGFHGYDFDLSLQTIKQNKKIIATNRILIEHFSDGHFNKDWYDTHESLYKKCKEILPLKSIHINYFNKISLDYSCFYSGLNNVKKSTNTQLINFIINHFSLHFIWYFFYKRLFFSKYSINGKRTNIQEA